MRTPEYISGSKKVIEALGYWPSFHDAEVVSFSVERALPFKADCTLARLAVHIQQYEAVGEGTPQYELVLCKSIVLRFLFQGICALKSSDFNHQNVIDSISVSPVTTEDRVLLAVVVESIWGFGCSLRCSSVEIEAIEALPV